MQRIASLSLLLFRLCIGQFLGICNQHLDFGDVFFGVTLEYHAGTFQVDFPCRPGDLMFLLARELNDLVVGPTNLVVGTQVD